MLFVKVLGTARLFSFFYKYQESSNKLMDALDSMRENLAEKDGAEQREIAGSPFAQSSARPALPLAL